MFSSILKIIPKLDNSSLRAMERALQSRFTKVAKGFGRGLVSVIKGGGIAGIALGLIDKLLNPLKEIQDSIDRTLKSSDDIATNARQFGTSSGKLAKLIAFGESTGLDQDSLFMLINKFQNAVAEAKADPNKPSSVSAFADNPDTAQAFFSFIQALQGMEKNQQLQVQSAVFGEKQILKMADFLQSDFAKQAIALTVGKLNTGELSKNIDSLSGKKDLTDTLAAKRNLFDFAAKDKGITEGIVLSRDREAKLALQKENQRIRSYQNLAAISLTVEKVLFKLEEGLALIGGFFAKATPFIDTYLGFFQTKNFDRAVRYLFSRGGK